MRDSSAVSTAAWGNDEARHARRHVTRRRWIASAAGAADLALLGTRAAHGRHGTPVASPVPADRDWESEIRVGSWATGVHVASAGPGEEFPSQIFALGGRTVRQAAIDFDAITRDPDHPARLLPAHDGGDHRLLNDVGFRTMADRIDLALFQAS